MANQEKSGFSNAAMAPPQGYVPQQYGMNPMTQPQGGANPPPYVMQGGTNVTSPYVTQPQYNQYGGPVIVTTQPERETGPPPDTTCSLIISILAIFFCLGAWPFAVVAIIFNRKAKNQVNMGQYTMAKGNLRTCLIFIIITVVLGIIAWVIFAIRLKAALDAIDNLEKHRNNYYG